MAFLRSTGRKNFSLRFLAGRSACSTRHSAKDYRTQPLATSGGRPLTGGGRTLIIARGFAQAFAVLARSPSLVPRADILRSIAWKKNACQPRTHIWVRVRKLLETNRVFFTQTRASEPFTVSLR
jgi:hypothetical protein